MENEQPELEEDEPVYPLTVSEMIDSVRSAVVTVGDKRLIWEKQIPFKHGEDVSIAIENLFFEMRVVFGDQSKIRMATDSELSKAEIVFTIQGTPSEPIADKFVSGYFQFLSDPAIYFSCVLKLLTPYYGEFNFFMWADKDA